MLDWQTGLAFDQTQIDRMRLALTYACRALAFAFAHGEIDETTRERLARSIIDCAAKGEFRPARLSAEALRTLPPFEATHAVSILSPPRRAA